jgi:hypothetical protein
MWETRHWVFAIALFSLTLGGCHRKTIEFENRTSQELQVVLIGPAELTTGEGTGARFEPVKVLPPGQSTIFDIQVIPPASVTWKAGQFSELAKNITIGSPIPGDYGGNAIFPEGFFSSLKPRKQIAIYPSAVYYSPALETNATPLDFQRRWFDMRVIWSLDALKKLQDGMQEASAQKDAKSRDQAWENKVPLLLKKFWEWQVKAQDAFQKLTDLDNKEGQEFLYREELLRHLQATVVEAMLRIGEIHELGLEGAGKNPGLAVAYYKRANMTSHEIVEKWKGNPKDDPQILRAEKSLDRMWDYYRNSFPRVLFKDSDWAAKARIWYKDPAEGPDPIAVSPDGLWAYARIDADGFHYKFQIVNPKPKGKTYVEDIVLFAKDIAQSTSTGPGGETTPALEMGYLRLEGRDSMVAFPAEMKSSWQVLRMLKDIVPVDQVYQNWPLSTPPKSPKE